MSLDKSILTPSKSDGENNKNISPDSSAYNRKWPFADSELYFTKIKYAEKLTFGEDVKTVYKIGLDRQNIPRNFSPGDTIGIVPRNNTEEIQKLCRRIWNLDYSIENNYPKEIETAINILLRNVDIRTPPKKKLLKDLIKYTTNSEEVHRLELMISREGTEEYRTFILGPGRTFLGILNEFPSCNLSLENFDFLAHLPPLQPRPFSICSSTAEDALELTFFVAIDDNGVKGLCTGWLEQIIEHQNDDKIPFYFRKPTKFRIPDSITIPLILISTGTGIAPFRSFWKHRSLEENPGKIWLIYGCRYSNRDCLFKEEIQSHYKNKTLFKVDFAFSREIPKCYVQDCIEKNESMFNEWIFSLNAKIFICGNAKTVVKDVKSCIVNNFVKFQGVSVIEAEQRFLEMQKNDQIIIDSWA